MPLAPGRQRSRVFLRTVITASASPAWFLNWTRSDTALLAYQPPERERTWTTSREADSPGLRRLHSFSVARPGLRT